MIDVLPTPKEPSKLILKKKSTSSFIKNEFQFQNFDENCYHQNQLNANLKPTILNWFSY